MGFTQKDNVPQRLLDSIDGPQDLKSLSMPQLQQLGEELRQEIIGVVSSTGGHLGSSLGAVEITMALHYVFDTPRDQIVWDVGHQAYGHKILTGRRDRFHTLRQEDGLSGFPMRSESAYDTFGVAHASTAISAALGMTLARDLREAGFPRERMHVVGDAFSPRRLVHALGEAHRVGRDIGSAKRTP